MCWRGKRWWAGTRRVRAESAAPSQTDLGDGGTGL